MDSVHDGLWIRGSFATILNDFDGYIVSFINGFYSIQKINQEESDYWYATTSKKNFEREIKKLGCNLSILDLAYSKHPCN